MKQFWQIQANKNTGKAEIFIYGYIDPFDVSASEFVKELRNLEKDHGAIDVRINSGGGSVFEGIAIYNALVASRATINTYVDGLAASMASIIAQAGEKRYISKYGQFMTHKPSIGAYGNANEHKKNIELLEGIEGMMVTIYANKAKLTAEQAREKFMNGKDEWFDAAKAIENGLADEQYDAEEVAKPAANLNEKEMVEYYQVGIAAKLITSTNTNYNMKQFQVSAAIKTALNIDDSAEQSAIEAAITGLQIKVTSAEAAQRKAEKDLADYKKEQVKNNVIAMVDAAVKNTQCTKEAGELLKVQFAEKEEELKALLGTMKPYTPVTQQAGDAGEVDAKELAEIIKLSGEEIFKQSKFDRLKELDMTSFKMKYREYFGEEYKEEKGDK